MVNELLARARKATARLLFAAAVTCGSNLYSQTESDGVNQASDASSATQPSAGCVCDDACDALVSEPMYGHDLSLGSWLDGYQTKLRQGLSNNGITFTNNLTNFYFGNTRGGL